MAVSTAAIKKLREETEAPVMEVKHALEEAKGDAAKAKDILREKAVMRAEKKMADLVGEASGTLGEHVKIERFVRYDI